MMGVLTMVAGAPERKQATRATTEQDERLVWAIAAAYMAGEHAYRLARWLREWIEDEGRRADRLHAKVFDPALADHPKREEARERLFAMERAIFSERGRLTELDALAGRKREELRRMWTHLGNDGAGEIERMWRTGAKTPDQFVRWVEGMWEQEYGTVEGVECPF